MREEVPAAFVPTDEPLPDELETLKETADETEFVSHDEIDWD